MVSVAGPEPGGFAGPGFVSIPDMTRSIRMMPAMANSNLAGLKVVIVLLSVILTTFVEGLGKAKGRQLCCLTASCEEVVTEISSSKPLAVNNQSAERARDRKAPCQTCNHVS